MVFVCTYINFADFSVLQVPDVSRVDGKQASKYDAIIGFLLHVCHVTDVLMQHMSTRFSLLNKIVN